MPKPELYKPWIIGTTHLTEDYLKVAEIIEYLAKQGVKSIGFEKSASSNPDKVANEIADKVIEELSKKRKVSDEFKQFIRQHEMKEVMKRNFNLFELWAMHAQRKGIKAFWIETDFLMNKVQTEEFLKKKPNFKFEYIALNLRNRKMVNMAAKYQPEAIIVGAAHAAVLAKEFAIPFKKRINVMKGRINFPKTSLFEKGRMAIYDSKILAKTKLLEARRKMQKKKNKLTRRFQKV